MNTTKNSNLKFPAATALFALFWSLTGCAAPVDEDGGDSTSVQCSADADCSKFDDGDVCNGTWRCTESSTCALDAKTVVVCDPKKDSVCAVNRCAAATGKCALAPVNNGASCEDDDLCTVGDRCAVGKCEAGPGNRCPCKTDLDCPDDSDMCTGTLFCDKAVFPGACRLNPATVPQCSTTETACAIGSCDPKTGKCDEKKHPDGTICDDGDACTVNDLCAAGKCAAGNDNKCICKSNNDCEGTQDDDLCNGTLYCDLKTNKCVVNPATVVTCPTAGNTTCSKRACQKATGLCVLAADNQGKSCDDGQVCTKGDVCLGGLCSGKDTCICSEDKDCAKDEDGNVCNGTLYCNKQSKKCALNPATLISCPTVNDTVCKRNACVPKTGKCAMALVEKIKNVCVKGDKAADGKDGAQVCRTELLPDGAPQAKVFCDDGDKCTVSDVCAKGTCKGGTSVCTCKTDGDCAKTDDGDLCNGVPYCDKKAGECKPNPGGKKHETSFEPIG